MYIFLKLKNQIEEIKIFAKEYFGEKAIKS
jgi:hypothetical protein